MNLLSIVYEQKLLLSINKLNVNRTYLNKKLSHINKLKMNPATYEYILVANKTIDMSRDYKIDILLYVIQIG